MATVLAVLSALGITKEAWDKIPDETKKQIQDAVTRGQIALAKEMLKKVGLGNPKINPIEKAVADSCKTRFFGGKYFDFKFFSETVNKRGMVGEDQWPPKALSLPLRMFHKQVEADEIDEGTVDALLQEFSRLACLDLNRVRRHYWAIKLDYEADLLSEAEAEEKARKSLEELAEEAEEEEELEEEPESEEETEEEEAEEE